MVSVTVSGQVKLVSTAARIRAEGNKSLAKEMGARIKASLDPVDRAILASVAATMPSGYAPVLSRSLKFRKQVATTGRRAAVRHVTYATGSKERRDVAALEAGRLRHPVFGRSRAGRRRGERIANPWAVTKVQAGFHARGTRNAMEHAEDAMVTVLDGLATRLGR